MKTLTFVLALALVLGGVAASPAIDTASASHNDCGPEPRPCDPQPQVSGEYICRYLEHFGLCWP